MNKKWDLRFLDLAQYISLWSKDPSTKVGAVIVRPDKTICSVGYNGFPRGIEDTAVRLENRQHKYPRMVHAEMNAILNAKEPLEGYTLYVWPPAYMSPTCDRCAASIIQSGIGRVVGYGELNSNGTVVRWREATAVAFSMYREARVEVKLYYSKVVTE